jgi:hypothetical protein
MRGLALSGQCKNGLATEFAEREPIAVLQNGARQDAGDSILCRF